MLKEEKWDQNILLNARKITDGVGFMRTYDLNNGKIIKVLKSLNDLSLDCFFCYDGFREELENKLNYSRMIASKDIVLPNTVYYESDGIVAYEVPKVNGTSLSEALPMIRSLELYGNIISTLSQKVRLLNTEGIILPDLGNTDNVLYDFRKDKFSFIDYDGMQVLDSRSFSYSGYLSLHTSPIVKPKYGSFEEGWTKNLDILSLIIIYFLNSSGVHITDELDDISYDNPDFEVTKKNFETLFTSLGIDDEQMKNIIIRLYDETKDNIYPDEVIKEFSRTHVLTRNPQTSNKFYKRKE